MNRPCFRRRNSRLSFVLLCAALTLAAGACGPAFAPKQAQFTVTGCEAGAPAFDARAAVWKFESAPVLRPAGAGEWDSGDVLNPSVARSGDLFYNLYSGFDGQTWHTGLATSPDGVVWSKQGRVLSPDAASWESAYIAANGALLFDRGRFLYWYQAGERGRTSVGLAISEDARVWRKHPGPVLDRGAEGAWDDAGIGDPYVIRCGPTNYLYYLGQDGRGLQRLGLARSSDGIHWQRVDRNPVLDIGGPGSFDERGLGEPAVFKAGDDFYMLYTGRNAREERRVGWAQSRDGVDWEKLPQAPLLEGFSEWNSRVICDPTVLADGKRILVWFGGGDEPSPDEKLHGQIGLAWIDTPAE